ncbi:hypothetical protein BDC45DRAFT_514727 [Circinella umbellata]|nr:hypothetical protein BDC45DRAFT_514727 [Circinella umbellata]
MPPYCSYCRTEGHYISKCNNLKEQRKTRKHPYTSCGDTDHLNEIDVCCKNHTPVVIPIPPSPISKQATITTTESFNKKLHEFDTYMADHRTGTSMWDSRYAPTNISDDQVYHNYATIRLPSSAPSTPTSDWAFDHHQYLLLSQRLDSLHQEHQQQHFNLL